LLGGFDAFLSYRHTSPKVYAALVEEIARYGNGWYASIGVNEMAHPPLVETEAGFLEPSRQSSRSSSIHQCSPLDSLESIA
jgi:hypothetical protein